MGRKVIINQLELAYSPISNFDFTYLKHESVIQQAIERSCLYIIVQRPEIRFDNILYDDNQKTVSFEIRQHQNTHVLKCKVSIFQEFIATDPAKEVLLEIGSNDRNNDFNSISIMNVHGMKFYQQEISDDNFLVWFSPEKFLQNVWKGYIQADIEGDIRNFTRYKVHYVGQATKQEIWKRLTGHDKLQDILSLEYPFTYGSLPTHEIALLLFSFHDNLEIYKFDEASSVEEMTNSLMGKNRPEQRTIFLDAEKALINGMLPKYNDELFKNYPRSADGLYKHKYDAISYSFTDPIILVYDKGEIEGSLDYMGGDTIIVEDNKTVELFKHKK